MLDRDTIYAGPVGDLVDSFYFSFSNSIDLKECFLVMVQGPAFQIRPGLDDIIGQTQSRPRWGIQFMNMMDLLHTYFVSRIIAHDIGQMLVKVKK